MGGKCIATDHRDSQFEKGKKKKKQSTVLEAAILSIPKEGELLS